MTVAQAKKAFDNDAEFLKFDRVEKKRSDRPDLHAFLLLDTLVGGNLDIVSCAEHDKIWLEPSLEELAPNLTPAIVLELVRCGVRLDDYEEGLAMYV